MDFDAQNSNVNSEVPASEAKDYGGANDSRGNKILLVVLTFIAIAAATLFIMRETRGTRTKHTSSLIFPALDAAAMDPYKGKVVLVNFWATWCEPCRVEVPWLIEFQQKYSDRGFTVLGVAMDEDGNSAVAPFVENERFEVHGKPQAMNYPIFIGNDQIAEKFGGIIGYPTSVLISRDGRQVRRITGLISHDEIAKAIEALL
ncbi:MAG TPA: TlpA disulfide reductase family protein [Candidatus Dormibacteraeota bacterium]|nr:TlpA disulfide reductase family protein [Candidatus Dormibacteraeota bacterium]